MAFDWFLVGLLLLAMGSSINTLAVSGGQGCLMCLKSAGLSPSMAVAKGLGEPGLDEKFTMS